MQSNNFTDFVAYFRRLADEHKEIEYFAHGPAARILALTRTGFKYPCLWLETPSLLLIEKDGTDPEGVRQCALVVLTQAGGNYVAQDNAYAQTERIALELVSRMRKDRKLRLFSFNGNVRLDAISSLTMDKDIGWRVEFETSKTTGLCYSPDNWNPPTV